MKSPESSRSFSLKNELDPELQFREGRSEIVLSLLDKLHAEEAFANDESRQQFIEELTFEKIKKIGLLTNDILRGKSGSEDFDGGNVLVQGNMADGSGWTEYLPPAENDRETLLSEVLEQAKKLDTKEAAVLTGLGIVATHPFLDGNGRISRLFYTLLSDGYDGSNESKQKLQEILGENGRESVDLSPVFLMPYIKFALEKKSGINHRDPHSVTEAFCQAGGFIGSLTIETLPVMPEITKTQRQRLLEIIDGTDKLKVVTFHEFLKRNDMLTEPYINYKEVEGRYEQFKRPDKWTTVQIDEVLKSLNIEQVDELISVSQEMRKKSVKTMIEIFAEPEKYKFKDNSTLKDHFILQIQKKKT